MAVLSEEQAQVEHRLTDCAFGADEKRHEQPADSAIAVIKR